MKITQKQLKQIIKEEKRKLLREAYPVGGDRPNPKWKAFEDAAWAVAAELIDAGMESDGVENAMLDSVRDIIAKMDSEQYTDQYSEGTSLDQMSSSWRQVLGSCLEGKKGSKA